MPIALGHAAGGNRLGQPVLRIFHLHQPQLADLARLDHRARMAQQRVAAVGMGQREQQILFLRQCRQLPAFLQRNGQRLVADHMDARFQERGGDRRMQVVGRDDGDCLDAVGARGLGLRHGAVVAVAALGRDMQRLPACQRARRIGRQGAGHQLVLVVDARRNPVHGADECALPATDHAQP